MKKAISLILVLALSLTVFASCNAINAGKDAVNGTATDAAVSDTTSASTDSTNASSDESTTAGPITTAPAYENGMEEKYDQLEYDIYYNLMYNKAQDYVGQQRTITGIFGSIIDIYNGRTRYYVWGYKDTTKCCCYQWEFKAPDGFTAPANGSTVTLTGTLTQSTDALDSYWFENCTFTVDKAFTPTGVDFDLTTVSATLAYVQIANMVYAAQQGTCDDFNNKTVRIYGRALNISSIQDPYYDDYWSLDFKWDGDAPAIGEYIVLDGVFNATDGGCVVNATNISLVN